MNLVKLRRAVRCSALANGSVTVEDTGRSIVGPTIIGRTKSRQIDEAYAIFSRGRARFNARAAGIEHVVEFRPLRFGIGDWLPQQTIEADGRPILLWTVP